MNNENIKTIGVSDKRAALYKKIGIETIGDLITHYPTGYTDFTAAVPVSAAKPGETAVIRATAAKKLAPYIGKVSVYKILLNCGDDSIICTFFNSEYNFSRVILNKEYIFSGKISENALTGQKEILSPLFITPGDPNKLIPKYRLTKGLSRESVSADVKNALNTLESGSIPDLPAEIVETHSLMPVSAAIRKIHFPESAEDCRDARRTLIFKELLVLQLGLSMIRERNRKLSGAVMQSRDISAFYANLPFKPTSAQMRAVTECVTDMKRKVPMNRLLQGDVGSGKTMVAAALAYFAHLNGYQTVIMAPTEILASQHYKTLTGFLTPLGVKCVLLTGGVTAAEKKRIRAEIKSGEASLIAGTHAIIQAGTEFNALGLAVTDEQHRFGVGQRSALISKGANPHTLVMSATPIPRTLGLIIYGDLDISLLDEMPKGRIPIKTYAVDSSYRDRIYKFILKLVAEGRQAYIVCPLIEESESENFAEKASAVKYYNELCGNRFGGGITTGLLHGRMKNGEKDEVMRRFAGGEIKVLVSTTVIEVGVDVPNAAVMLIENAEQFGLSQLHQLRGRVGRGKEQSYCILVTDVKSPYTKARIEVMTRTADGFEIAGEDLKLRGPGDFFGSKQHGLPVMKIAHISDNTDILEETQTLARSIIKEDSELNLPKNRELKILTAELFKDANEYGYN